MVCKQSKLLMVFAAISLVCFMAGTSLAAAVSDIDGHWAKSVIEKWLNSGLATGYSDGTFKPDRPVSRAEFVALVNRAFNKPATGTNPGFSDVQPHHWFYNDVATATVAGYIYGYSDGTFRPNASITREEVAVIVARLLDLDTQSAGGTNFTDSSSISDWAKGSVNAVAAKGIMQGYPDGSFGPGKLITRAEALVVLDRALSLIEIPVEPTPEAPVKPETPPASTGGGGGGGGSGGGGGGGGQKQPVTAISVTPKELKLGVGQEGIITATVEPANATNKKVNWSSDNEEVATVENGKVTAVGTGTAIITATSDADNSKKDSCVVRVFSFQDIQVKGNGFVNSTSLYKGVFVEISTPGSANDKIQSFKVELFNANDELIGTNTLKPELLKANGGSLPDSGLTSPFVVIPEEGGYSSQSWITDWEEGEPNPTNAPAYALITAIDNNGLSYSAEETYTGDWRSVWAQDIHVSTTNSFYVQDPNSYKGVTTEFAFSGEDLDKIVLIKVELFAAGDVLIGTNTLKSEKLKSNGGTLPSAGALTSPFVVIPGEYTSGSWVTVWEEGKLSPFNAPVKAVITAVDNNGLAYTAEDNDFNSFSGNGGTWASIFAVEERDDVFEITTAGQLQWLADALSADPYNFDGKTFKLLNDIDLEGMEWIPINTWAPENRPSYIFDGNEKSIINMTVEGASKLGFIGNNAANWTIRDLTFENTVIEGTGSFIGTVIGYQYGDVIIENVKVTGGEITTSIGNRGIRIGGLVGFSILSDGAKLTLDNCDVSDVVIQGYHNVGGLVGTLIEYTTFTDRWEISECDVEGITLIYGSGNQNHISPFAVDGSTFPSYDENNQTFVNKGNTFSNVEIILD